jgi:tripartite-type tricarboxylate transporter receptor subunit TctC
LLKKEHFNNQKKPKEDKMKVTKMTGFFIAIFALLIGLTGLADTARAEYPNRPITIIVPWGAGGGTDTISRVFAKGFEKEMGVPVNVVNRTGGAGLVGHSAMAMAKPDGYTLGVATSEFTFYKALGQGDISAESYDIISRIAITPAGITVKANAPYKNLGELLEAIKENPKDTYSSSGCGVGCAWHIAVAGLLKSADIPPDKLLWIPSKGGAPALQDVVAGGTSMYSGSPVEAKALIAANEIRALAMMMDERSPLFPEVPTCKEQGYDWIFLNWYALVAPKGLDEDAKAKIIEAAKKAHASKEVRETLDKRGIIPVWDGPEASKEFAGKFQGTVAEILKDLGLAK